MKDARYFHISVLKSAITLLCACSNRQIGLGVVIASQPSLQDDTLASSSIKGRTRRRLGGCAPASQPRRRLSVRQSRSSERDRTCFTRSHPEPPPERSAEMRCIVETPTKGDFSDRNIRHLRMYDFSPAALQSLPPNSPHQRLGVAFKQFIKVAQRQSDVARDQ